MNAKEALTAIYAFIKEEPVILATGFIARTAQSVKERDANFYVIGSMGMVASLASGIAIVRPGKKVIGIDGDGAVLMNLGALPTAAALGLKNFIHIVLDNAAYESTGAQPSFTKTVKLEAIAKASGYANALRVSNAAGIKKAMPKLLKTNGPSFLLVRVTNEAGSPAPRVEATPEEMTRRFSKCLAR
ncbi:MAG: sulfopyruvate decarboxylase subunit beta [Micavibrio sp.]|nr:sulfopyruvate decarboxylase subunit beta [Micavibrio sp.]